MTFCCVRSEATAKAKGATADPYGMTNKEQAKAKATTKADARGHGCEEDGLPRVCVLCCVFVPGWACAGTGEAGVVAIRSDGGVGWTCNQNFGASADGRYADGQSDSL